MDSVRVVDEDIDSLVEAAATYGELAAGTPARWLAARKNGGRRVVTVLAGSVSPTTCPAPEWTAEEEEFLAANLGLLSEAEIAGALGRTAVAVHLRWSRDMGLPAPSKNPGVITARKISEALGVDSKAAMRWVDEGLLPGRRLPMGRAIRVVRRVTFLRWCVNPVSWIYFRPEKVVDPHIRRLIELKKERWGDEWWTPGQVAEYHGVHHQNVNRYIRAGKLPAVKWQNWRILRSQATDPGLRFYEGRGAGPDTDWSAECDAFLVLARAVGHSTNSIAALAGGWHSGRVSCRLNRLHREGRLPGLIREHGLQVQYCPETGRLLADWRAYRRRFPRLSGAARRFGDGRPLRPGDLNLVRGVLSAWAGWHAGDDRRREVARNLGFACNATPGYLHRAYAEVRSWGIDPLALLEGEM